MNEDYEDWTDEELAAITIPTRTDVNGKEFEYCPDHGSTAYASVYAFPCPVAVEGDPPEKRTCIYFQKYLMRILGQGLTEHYFTLIFPARLDAQGVLVRSADPEHPDQTGLVDKRIYNQEFRHDEPVGPPEPLSENQNPDGTYRNECLGCDADCKRCSWNRHCVCPGKAWDAECTSLYAPGEREAEDLDLEDEDTCYHCGEDCGGGCDSIYTRGGDDE